MNKKGGIELLILGIMFLLAGIMLLIFSNQIGYVPSEAIGQNEVRLLELKEQAVSELIKSDQAVNYAAKKSIMELANNGLLLSADCGYHLSPLLSSTCNYKKDYYLELLKENYDYYTRFWTNAPEYDFEIEAKENLTVKANPKDYLKVNAKGQTFSLGTTQIFDTLPTDSKVITSCFGERYLESEGEGLDFHDGIDFSAKNGASQAVVKAVEDGIVHSVCKSSCNEVSGNCNDPCSGYGTNIVIAHPNGFFTRYSHLDANSVLVQERSPVSKGQDIAKAGNTGYSKAAHLDFKIYSSVNDLSKKDSALSPLCYFSASAFTDVTFSPNAISCTKKYPGGLDLNNPPISLLEECTYSLPITEEIGEEIVQRAQKYNQLIIDSSLAAGVPDSLVKAVITQESGFDKDIVSPTGPVGLMQFEKTTAIEQGLVVNDQLDERTIPEKAIPAGARYISKFYTKYAGNVVATLISYNAGDLITRKAISDCGILTIDNYESCIKDPLIDYYSQERFTSVYGDDFPIKKLQETTNYVKKVSDYYSWWGGVIGQSASFGSYYEVYPYSEAIIDFDLRIFEDIRDFADVVIDECSDKKTDQEVISCHQDIATYYNDRPGFPISSQIPYKCDYELLTAVEQIDEGFIERFIQREEISDAQRNISKFISAYETCKNYAWEDLNGTCDCNIPYPNLDGIDVKILPDRIQFIKDSQLPGQQGIVFYEHKTAPQSLDPFISYLYNNRAPFLTFNRDELIIETLDGFGKIDHDGESKLYRTEEGIKVLSDGPSNICDAPIKTVSFCYKTDYTLPLMTENGKYLANLPVSIPFSVKLD